MRGTKEGEIEEKRVVVSINKRDTLGKNILETMGFNPSDNVYAVNVKGMIFGEIQNKKIKPKSDIYLIKDSKINEGLLSLKKYYLDESDIDKNNFIPNTGISIKLSDSSKYQILKVNPSSFGKIYGSNILASGASIYCSTIDSLRDNEKVLKAWGITKVEFINFFGKKIININLFFENSESSLEIAKEIKKISNNLIKKKTLEDESINNYVFKGTGNFPEPYVAHWIYKNGEFSELEPYDFNVTTGSGRSRGDYTIVFKPV